MPKTYEEMLDGSFDAVLREADSLYQTGGRLRETYDRVHGRLTELGVAHVLVGGYALILHGVRRFTEDIDLLVTDAGLEQLRDALLGRGYVSVPATSRSLRDTTTRVRIDFVVAGHFPGDGKPKPVVFPDPAQATEIVQGQAVVGLATLIELKLASGMTGKGRLQDLADVQRLIQTHALSAAYAERLEPSVRAKFLELL